MAQSITLKIAGTEYQLAANTPETEQRMRLAAEDINAMLMKYDSRFPERPLVDKLAFVALQEAVGKIAGQQSVIAVKNEIDALQADTDAYLKGIE